LGSAWTMVVAAALAVATTSVAAAELMSGADDPPFALDWQLGLRGGLVADKAGTRLQLVVLPQARLTRHTLRGGYSAGIAGELSRDPDGNARLGALTLDGSYDYRLDAVTAAGLKGSFALTQADPSDPGYADNVAVAPSVADGRIEASLRRGFGSLLTLELRGSAGRTLHGETTYEGGATASNADQNTVEAGLGARLGLRLTPGLAAFIDGEATSERHDAASPSLLARLDNRTYTARAGLEASFLDTLQLEGSLGLAYRDFADASLQDFGVVLYGARVAFHPRDTLALSADFTTRLESPDTTVGATARIVYAVTGEAAYAVNPWLRLRASAGWSEAHYQGAAAEESRWALGFGADYRLGARLDATADYSFARSTATPDPPEDRQQLMLGLTLHR